MASGSGGVSGGLATMSGGGGEVSVNRSDSATDVGASESAVCHR